MSKVTVKLGNGLKHFFDMTTGVSVFPGETKKVNYNNSKVKAALAVGTLIRAGKVEEENKSQDPLMAKTRKDIMEEYGFLAEEDLAKAEKCSTKADLVAFLREVEGDYED